MTKEPKETMSICPSPDKLDQMGSKYALVIIAAKRARQLKEGARRLVETRSTNPLTIALEEIAAGKIVPHEPEEVLLATQKALQPHEPSDADIIGAGTVLPIDETGQEAVLEDEVLQGVDPEAQEEDGEERVTAVDVRIREGGPIEEEEELLEEEGFDILPDIDEA
jgi:DNA-directed RNA polymerase subunit omega